MTRLRRKSAALNLVRIIPVWHNTSPRKSQPFGQCVWSVCWRNGSFSEAGGRGRVLTPAGGQVKIYSRWENDRKHSQKEVSEAAQDSSHNFDRRCDSHGRRLRGARHRARRGHQGDRRLGACRAIRQHSAAYWRRHGVRSYRRREGVSRGARTLYGERRDRSRRCHDIQPYGGRTHRFRSRRHRSRDRREDGQRRGRAVSRRGSGSISEGTSKTTPNTPWNRAWRRA